MEEGALLYHFSLNNWHECTLYSRQTCEHSKMLTIVLRSTDGLSFELKIDSDKDIDCLKLRNDPSESDVENLISLPYLHEPAILFCLERRYKQGSIYTYTGPILIALNPFQRLPLYTPVILQSYYNAGLLKGQVIPQNIVPRLSVSLSFYIYIYMYMSFILLSYLSFFPSQGIESDPLPPHVFAIADAAYRAMMKVVLG